VAAEGWGGQLRLNARKKVLPSSSVARSSDEVAETAWLIEELGRPAFGLAADVRDAAQVHSLVAQVGTDVGPVQTLVNSAGVGLRAPIHETDEGQWDTVMDTLVKGTYLFSHAVIPQMITQGGGNIINIGAPLDRIAVPGFAAYYAAKCAVDGLTRVMAKDLRRFGINVNTLHPGGFVDTRMVRETVPEARKGLLDPSEIAAAAVELAALTPRAHRPARRSMHIPSRSKLCKIDANRVLTNTVQRVKMSTSRNAGSAYNQIRVRNK
jgi:3-oxoacyl-[acyl-carrier protein] reductase